MPALAAVQPNDGETPGIPNPLGVEALQPFMHALKGSQALWLGLGVASAASLVMRFRRSRGEERQQIKWVVYAVVFLASYLVAAEFLGGLLPVVLDQILGLIALAGLWVAILIAVLKYRLYDIDVLINRTLVYATLTATLALVYLGGVALLRSVVLAPVYGFTGRSSQLVIVASTLAVAALFSPLRRRIQGFIDRRFYRSKYDAKETLETFGAKLRDDLELETLSTGLVEVVRETVQPAHVSLWLRPDAASKGEGSGDST